MQKLTQTDGQGVPIPRHTDVVELRVGCVSAGGHRGHPTVDGIEAVGRTGKVSGVLDEHPMPDNLAIRWGE